MNKIFLILLLFFLSACSYDFSGPRGSKGDKGDTGASIKGDKGDPGLSIKGDKGDPGDIGPMGVMGMQGQAGPNIISGKTLSSTEPLDNQVLSFNSTADQWESKTLTSSEITGCPGGMSLISGNLSNGQRPFCVDSNHRVSGNNWTYIHMANFCINGSGGVVKKLCSANQLTRAHNAGLLVSGEAWQNSAGTWGQDKIKCITTGPFSISCGYYDDGSSGYGRCCLE